MINEVPETSFGRPTRWQRSKCSLTQAGPRDTKSMKSTSSVFTRTDGLIIGMNAQLQDTHAQSSLGAGCADGLYVKAMLDDLGMRAKINLRCDAKAARALAQRQGLSKRTQHVTVKYEYVRQSERSRSVESCKQKRPSAESQTGIPQEFDGKEFIESDNVPFRHCKTIQWI